MLTELVVRDLGVIAEATVLVGPGMTALTGETGAGKTLLVSAIELLVGGRADPLLVRPGATEARVDGRFVGADGAEVVLSRVVPADGRSRAYLDGRPVPASVLAEHGAELVDLHGQHAHQSLLAPAVQRAALDTHGGVDLEPLLSARAALTEVDNALAELGGDERARARELDLVRFQVAELDAAAVTGADEDVRLAEEEALLADAAAAREAGAAATALLHDDDGALDTLGSAVAQVAGRPAFTGVAARLRSLAIDLGDASAELRDLAEAVVDDPDRLDALRERRALLRDLRRKYGDSLADVLAFAEEARTRLGELETHDARAAALDTRRKELVAEVAAAAAAVRAARVAAGPGLAADVEGRLATLAMAGARVEVAIGEQGAGDEVVFLLAANPGEPARPLARVASGGELARIMLALRLALLTTDRGGQADGRTLVFDEVDAGIGGEAALAVAASLADLARSNQILVVTHLPQVAAHADGQVVVVKAEEEGRTIARAHEVRDDERVAELSRMLSGQPGREVAKGHAAELLTAARRRPH
ncbi:MAG TPA: DNA repair protein RecN [Acidimicrobiales bacterium]